MIDDPRSFLRSLFTAAVDAARAEVCMEGALPPPPSGRTVVAGAGKAASAMASFVESRWQGSLSGTIITPYGHALATRCIETVQASHPVPDAAGITATRRILDQVQDLNSDDLVLALMSGGGSSLLVAPAEGMALEDKQAVTRMLLRCGAAIDEMNCVRKHLSAIKGGRLAAAAFPAPVVTLAISDVPGDDPAVIASGPAIGDPGTRHDARAILDHYDLDVPEAVVAWLDNEESETPKPDDRVFVRASATILTRAHDSLLAAFHLARKAGAEVTILGDDLEGEASEVGRSHAALVRHIAGTRTAASPPQVILSGGETTVTWNGVGRGGRNQEYLLALAVELDGMDGIHALACDTDGIDGTTKAAGACINPSTPARARIAGLEPSESLVRQDSGGFFESLADQIVTGPTRTNVNDFRAILVS